MATTSGNLTTARRTFAEIPPTPGPGAPGAAPLQFGDFVLLPSEGRLLRDGHDIPLAPKPFETLLYLIRHADHVVSKHELLDAVWPGTYISEDGLVQCVVEIRRALGDSAKSPRYVQTLPKRGYRLLVPTPSDAAEAETRFVLEAAIVDPATGRKLRDLTLHADRRSDVQELMNRFSRELAAFFGVDPSGSR
jgi:DNA-binding winged helix-turn-helix (wHTH) protein